MGYAEARKTILYAPPLPIPCECYSCSVLRGGQLHTYYDLGWLLPNVSTRQISHGKTLRFHRIPAESTSSVYRFRASVWCATSPDL